MDIVFQKTNIAILRNVNHFRYYRPSIARTWRRKPTLRRDARRPFDSPPPNLAPCRLHSPEGVAHLNNLALLLLATNRLGLAEPLFRRALVITAARYGPDHPDVAIRFNNLASPLHDTNRLGEAEPLYCRALAIAAASYGPDHPSALPIFEVSLGAEHPHTAIVRRHIAALERLGVGNRVVALAGRQASGGGLAGRSGPTGEGNDRSGRNCRREPERPNSRSARLLRVRRLCAIGDGASARREWIAQREAQSIVRPRSPAPQIAFA
jgi:Tetratricopeptide repeat